MGQVLVLFWAGVVAAGVGGVAVGLLLYRSCLGWFISVTRRESLERAVEDAERHLTRRARRRHGAERRRRLLGAAGARPAGRHLAP